VAARGEDQQAVAEPARLHLHLQQLRLASDHEVGAGVRPTDRDEDVHAAPLHRAHHGHLGAGTHDRRRNPRHRATVLAGCDIEGGARYGARDDAFSVSVAGLTLGVTDFVSMR
jgi:hypothetical protein